MNEDDLKNIMQQDSQAWFTLSNLSAKTNLPQLDVQKIIKNSKLFVQSSSLTDEGENLFTTRDEFQEKGSLGNKILGAFKNRID